jgi:hypothetical protein
MFTAVLLALATTLSAQFVVGLDHYQPAGRFGRLFEQGVGLSVGYSPSNTISRYEVSYVARLYRITTHRDTMLSAYGPNPNHNGNFGPGYEVYQPTYYGELGMQGMWRLFPDRPFSPLATISVQAFTSHMDRESVTPGIGDTTSGRADYGAGASVGIGAEYELNRNFSLRASLSHTFQYGNIFGITRYFRTGVSAVYYW